MNFDFGEVLTRAWQISWRHKVLWGISALPFLIALVLLPIWLTVVFRDGFDPDRLDQLLQNRTFVITGACFYLVTIVGSVFLQGVSRSSATLGVFRAETIAQPATFADLLQDGYSYVWKILGVDLLIGLAISAFFIVVFACVAILSAITMGLAALCVQPFFLLTVPVILLAMTIMEQAESAVIADKLNVLEAIRQGFALVRQNLGRYIVITLIVYIGMNFLSGLITFPFMLPMLFIMMRTTQAGFDLNGLLRAQAILGLFLLPVLALVQGFSLTYLKSAMMVTYLRLTRSPRSPQPAYKQAVA